MANETVTIDSEPHSSGPGVLWAETTGSPEICVAVVDGPVDLTLPCFNSDLLTRLETVSSARSDSGAAAAHGTHVASEIFAEHDSELKGIAPRCRGLILPVFEGGPNQQIQPCSQLDLARSIMLAVQHGAHVINISAGQFDASGEAEPVLREAVERCHEHGVLIVSAAGNDGCACLHLPAALPNVLVVGAMDRDGNPQSFSNWGEQYRDSGVLAPGIDIPGAVPGGGVTTRSGTSFATPIVSGVAALLLSLQIKRGKQADPLAIRDVLLRSAIGCEQSPVPDCNQLLTGRLNIAGALELLLSENSEMSNTIDSNQAPQTRPSSCELPDASVRLQGSAVPDATVETPVSAARVQPAELLDSGSETVAPQSLTPSDTSTTPLSAGAPAAVTDTAQASCNVAPSSTTAPLVVPSACGCGGGTPPSLVYALGRLSIDYGTEANHDAFAQLGISNPHDHAQVIDHLNDNPAHAQAITWTLEQEATPIYAVAPVGPFSDAVFARLREFLADHLAEGEQHAERVSIPGVTSGSTTLMNGQTVPVIVPDIRGMYSWNTADLLANATESAAAVATSNATATGVSAELRNFLDRVYYEIRNLGVTSHDRAINYAATNAFQATEIYSTCHEQGLYLDSIGVERSPICRPGSDCWDVKLTFFNPTNRTEQARQVHRFTIDVSGTIPVTVGQRRMWHVY